MRRISLIPATILLILSFSLSIPQTNAAVLSGWGTATIDGVINAAEWAGAGTLPYSASSYTGIIYMMNDGTTLYIGITIIGDIDFGPADGMRIFFDNNNGGETFLEDGDDLLYAQGASAFADNYYDFGLGISRSDMLDGGSINGQSAGSRVGSTNHFELSHPLNTLDNAHDFSLLQAQLVGFLFQPQVDGTFYSAGIGLITNPSTWLHDYQVSSEPFTGPPNVPPSSVVVGGVQIPVNNLMVLLPYFALLGSVCIVSAILVTRKKNKF